MWAVLFPKDFIEHGVFGTAHAMLGLGDIVVPGLIIAFMLRFDQQCARLGVTRF